MQSLISHPTRWLRTRHFSKPLDLVDTVYCMLLLGLDPIPRFQSLHLNIGPVTNTFLSFFSGSFQCPGRSVSWNLSLRCPHGNAQSKFKVKHGQTWAGGGKHMFGVWIGYGSGMERGMERKALTCPDSQTFCYEYDFQALSFVQAGAASYKIASTQLITGQLVSRFSSIFFLLHLKVVGR